jgi:hypothetical protein
MNIRISFPKSVFFLLFVINSVINGQNVHTLFIEIKTGDKRFAGTDDPVHLFLGGKDFNLDNPDHDDFERNHTDNFTFSISDPDYSVEIIMVRIFLFRCLLKNCGLSSK